MGVDVVAPLTAVAAVMALVAAAAITAGLVIGPRLAPLERLVWWVRDRALGSIAIVAAVSTAGSLYYSEVAGFVPCEYCWYQRIAMYPIVVVAGLGALRGDHGARLPVAVLAATGLAISSWHWTIQQWPSLAAESCSTTVRCTIPYVEELGVVTIPFMSAAGFLLVVVVLVTTVVLVEPDRQDAIREPQENRP